MTETMVNSAGEDQQSPSGQNKKKSSLLPMLMVALLAAASGTGGGMVWAKRALKVSTAHDHGKSAAGGDEDAQAVHSLLPIGESLVVNLADKETRAYLRAGVELGLAREPQAKGGEKSLDPTPVARDIMVTIFSAKTADELLSPEGKIKAKQDLTAELRKRLPQQQIREVYFTEFLVQR